MNLLETLRQFPALAGVPDEQLQWLIDRSSEVDFPAETILYKPNDPVAYLILLLEGRIRIESGSNGIGDELLTYDAHSILGVLPFSRMKNFPNRLVAEKATRLLQFHRDQMTELIHTCYELTEALVHQMTTRVRDFTKLTQQNEKMASLGRLSAGLAHELNNPVAAVVRSADTLKTHMRATPEAFKTIMHLSLTDEQVDSVNTVFFGKLDQCLAKGSEKPLTLLERSSLEDDLTDWLDDHGVDDSMDLAGPLVEYCFTVADLDWILEKIGDKNLIGVINWLVNNLVTERLVLDISEASKRISTLVGSIKNYTHMDRGVGKERVQLAEGIRNTLILLDHKVRSKHISVTLNLPSDLPDVCGWPGELNQVWTNLIDNAVDALPDGGKLEISSQVDRRSEEQMAFVLTKVIDNGGGIPQDIQDKIFEPFFTTKEIGKGTGLGLDIVQGVVKHHNGSIKVQSEPGRTEFSVCLPTE
ncbi:cyclic nucleotide-binding domain-containing protein [Spirosoma sp. HMF3257]|uniref:histidine kinase n=1 Tax=Spirosoma telluris TaxID=2183553 RepID=A0A327NP93_9BACT|nr:cyclic nucleotide-binding domain-containing protein [Spirosoma telluris]RAI77042.1 histidine kinase [Spirosoma telluris]